ncbi:hypothetical protein PAXRUDRAFT_688354 [Paxillus rubicundulus Ve08.2h10]|uniref:Uncharacterized protein n=1 Tax=Paxillus rubicundulus Ve08.2h10 TaxID=930991 RepID=A0A0D0DTY1_9AGAM|nr:hypothetical protein PAXRUDRAFT_688354 [Paxillus rubicundulus Ve08.2h10]
MCNQDTSTRACMQCMLSSPSYHHITESTRKIRISHLLLIVDSLAALYCIPHRVPPCHANRGQDDNDATTPMTSKKGHLTIRRPWQVTHCHCYITGHACSRSTACVVPVSRHR